MLYTWDHNKIGKKREPTQNSRETRQDRVCVCIVVVYTFATSTIPYLYIYIYHRHPMLIKSYLPSIISYDTLTIHSPYLLMSVMGKSMGKMELNGSHLRLGFSSPVQEVVGGRISVAIYPFSLQRISPYRWYQNFLR